jgi:hypothetical protein
VTRLEQKEFIDVELRGLWPQWEPAEAELRVWMTDLAPLACRTAREAAQACFREQTVNARRPVLRRFLDKARALSRTTARGRSEPPDVQTRVFLECLEAPRWNVHMAGRRTGVYVQPTSRQDDLDYVRACAEPMRKRFEQLYGGHWIIVTDKPPRGESASGREPAARSPKSAIERAHAELLTGPDTPTRRRLQAHLARRGPGADTNTEPAGGELGDCIGFCPRPKREETVE